VSITQILFQNYYRTFHLKWCKTGVAKLRLASRMRHFEHLHAALWAFRIIIYLFFYFYCKV